MNAPKPLPTGTLTFVFTDIEGSTRLLTELGEGYEPLLRTHAGLLRQAIKAHEGIEVGTEGDSFFAVFGTARRAVEAVVAAQRSLATASWPEAAVVRVRMGLHSGEGRLGGDDYVGLDVNRTARIAAAGHGGQVLISDATRVLVGADLPEGVSVRDLGRHWLKDLPEPEHLWQLEIEGLANEFPALRSLTPPVVRLPAPISSFVGRREVEEAARLVQTTRLLTLTGPGGTGKTRLAIEVASRIAPRFSGGTWFVALDAVTEPQFVASEIVTSLGLAAGSDPPLERLLDYLREREVLLVLDNLEQVIDVATDVARILRECADVFIIATSRIPLRVSGEQEFPVPALALPSAADTRSAEVASSSEAVRLFEERARSVRHDFKISDENAASIVDIVTRLDGLPLAIELAAARLRTMPVDVLYRRLDDRLSALTGGARDLPDRQRTLRGAIDWSHDLLDEADRRLFARMGVIAGSPVLEQLEPILGPAAELERDVADGLESLVGQSLVRLIQADEGEPRFDMLATIREFAQERLEASGEAERIRRRHAETFVGLAERAGPELIGPDGAIWNDRLEADNDDMRQALDWIVGRDEAELGLRMIAALWRFWQVRGHLNEGAQRVDAVLGLPSVQRQPSALRAKGEAAAGGIAWWRSDFEATHRHYAAALAHARASDDEAILAEALYNAGFVPDPAETDVLRRYLMGRPMFEEALSLYERLGDKRGVATCLWALAYAKAAEQDIDGTIDLARQSLELSREIGDPFATGWAATLLGQGEMVSERFDESAAAFGEALAIWTEAGDMSGILLLITMVAMLADLRGRPERRWRIMGAADRIRAETGTDLVNQDVEFLGWRVTARPGSDEQRAWFEQGSALSTDEAIDLASAEISEGR